MDVLAFAGQYGWIVAIVFFLVVVASPRLASWFRRTIERQWNREDRAEAKQTELYERLLSAQQKQHNQLVEVIQQNTSAYNHVSEALGEIRQAFQIELGKLTTSIRGLTEQVARIDRRVSDLEKDDDQ